MGMGRGMGAMGPEAFIGIGMAREPRLSLTIDKRDNGYVIDLLEPAKPKDRPKPTPMPTEDEINARLDAISNGLSAFMKSILDKEAGDDWKDGDAKEKIREAIKAFAPSLGSPMAYQNPPIPRIENKVFEKKADLLKYLDENL